MGEVSVGQSLSMIAFLVLYYYSNCSFLVSVNIIILLLYYSIVYTAPCAIQMQTKVRKIQKIK